ncbi:hypothetical protein B0H14DRAFT_2563663 [Mycena olivaceomarginata]|nr:hypothetical protein B0H14DRAFT_2563663 [Mycena olivaceomarginata]
MEKEMRLWCHDAARRSSEFSVVASSPGYNRLYHKVQWANTQRARSLPQKMVQSQTEHKIQRRNNHRVRKCSEQTGYSPEPGEVGTIRRKSFWNATCICGWDEELNLRVILSLESSETSGSGVNLRVT